MPRGWEALAVLSATSRVATGTGLPPARRFSRRGGASPARASSFPKLARRVATAVAATAASRETGRWRPPLPPFAVTSVRCLNGANACPTCRHGDAASGLPACLRPQARHGAAILPRYGRGSSAAGRLFRTRTASGRTKDIYGARQKWGTGRACRADPIPALIPARTGCPAAGMGRGRTGAAKPGFLADSDHARRPGRSRCPAARSARQSPCAANEHRRRSLSRVRRLRFGHGALGRCRVGDRRHEERPASIPGRACCS